MRLTPATETACYGAPRTRESPVTLPTPKADRHPRHAATGRAKATKGLGRACYHFMTFCTGDAAIVAGGPHRSRPARSAPVTGA
jgi:hypothetical protein